MLGVARNGVANAGLLNLRVRGGPYPQLSFRYLAVVPRLHQADPWPLLLRPPQARRTMKDSRIWEVLTGRLRRGSPTIHLPWGKIVRFAWGTVRVCLGLLLPHLFYLAIRVVLQKVSKCILHKIGC